MMKKSVLSTGLRWLWLVLVVIVIDFASKQWIMNNLMLHESMSVMPFFNFFYAHNYGAAFRFLADKGGWQRWFFAGIAIAIVVVLLVMMYR
ncbi:signal peptidase II, partial [Erwinia amylovora]|uniref:signal peptidase II n=1 Tax=Erwinia amylovora TaxID=552 RepID=UPI0020C102BC